MQDQDITAAKLIGLALEEYCLVTNPKQSHHFSGSTEKIHHTIHAASQKYSHVLLPLKDLHFATAGVYPYSSELFTALWMLTESGILITFWGSNGENWIERSIATDSQTCLDRWKQENFADNFEGLTAFRNFAKDIGDALLLQ